MRVNEEYKKDVLEVVHVIPQIEKLMGKSILITGASGLIGSSVVDILFGINSYFQADISLILTGRCEETVRNRFSYMNELGYRFRYFDILDHKELNENVDYIIHCAGNCSPMLYENQPVETLLGNIIGLRTVLECARKNDVERTLYVSSSEVYGIPTSHTPYKETDYSHVDILNPRSCYPCGKRAAETLCISYVEEYKMDIVIVRPGHIYGPSIAIKDDRAPAQFVQNALKKEKIVMRSPGTQRRSYCYALDCGSAIISVLCGGENGNAYNISNSESIVSVREFAETIAKIAGTEVVFENAADKVKKENGISGNSSLDAKKLESLGWRALFDINEGVKRTLEFGRI